MAESAISATDKLLFKRLADPDAVDIQSTPANFYSHPQTPVIRADDMDSLSPRNDLLDAFRSPSPMSMSKPPPVRLGNPSPSLFEKQLKAEMKRTYQEADTDEYGTYQTHASPSPRHPSPSPRHTSPSPPHSTYQQPESLHRSPSPYFPPVYEETSPPPYVSSARPPDPGMFDTKPDLYSTTNTPVSHRRKSRGGKPNGVPDFDSIRRVAIDENDPDVMLEKQGYLIELQKFKSDNIKLTREYSMDDTLESIKFEYDGHNLNQDMLSKREFMKEAIKWIAWGIVGANGIIPQKLGFDGPLLKLHGWTDDMTSDMTKFNRPLERIYKQYWRRSNTSPVVDLGMLFFGSMVMWHFKETYGPMVGPMVGLISGMKSGDSVKPASNPFSAPQPSANPFTTGPNPSYPRNNVHNPNKQHPAGVPFEIPSTSRRPTLARPKVVTPSTAASWFPSDGI